MTTGTMDPMVWEDGTDEADSFTGTYADDIALGMGGNDTLTGDGGAGQDSDGPSHDTINGNMGDDEVNGGQGNDSLHGGQGDDEVDGGAGDDSVYGDMGNDTLMGGGGNDELHGRDGHDSVDGGAGNDTLMGGMGHDRLEGGAGNDMIYGNMGNDFILGGGGNDTAFGHEGNDSIDAGAGNDFANGNQGMDTIMGLGGNDTLRGGRDNDRIDGGDGDDMIYGDKGSDNLDGGMGADTIYGDNMMGSPDHVGDLIVGGMEENWNDITDQHLALVEGMSGNKITYGDKLYGGAGDDTIHAGTSSNMDGSQNDTFNFQYPSGGQNATITFIHGNMLDGGAGDDSLVGAEGNDTLKGGADDDTLMGGNGADHLMGGTGDDELSDGHSMGGNMLMGDGGDDLLSAAYRAVVDPDTAAGGDATPDIVTGGAADTLNGGSGNDTLMASAAIGVDTEVNSAADDSDGDDNSPAQLTVVTGGKAGLVMISGSGNDEFDFTNAANLGAANTFRSFIQIDDFAVGSDKVMLNLDTNTADDVVTTAFDAMKTALTGQLAATATGLDAIDTATTGDIAVDGNDTFVHIGSNVVLKFIGISAAQLAGNQVFFEDLSV